MSKKNKEKENDYPPYEEKDLKKEDIRGKRREKRKDKDYEKKYGDDRDKWN